MSGASTSESSDASSTVAALFSVMLPAFVRASDGVTVWLLPAPAVMRAPATFSALSVIVYETEPPFHSEAALACATVSVPVTATVPAPSRTLAVVPASCAKVSDRL